VDWGRWGFSEVFWVMVVLALVTGLSLAMVFIRKDIAYGITVLWALAGIIIKRSAGAGGQDRITVYASIAGIALISIAVLIQIVRRKVYK
jgi:hypothetical protein